MKKQNQPIIFFDGVCGLCNRSVDFLLRHDKRGQFLFAPLQGETAANLLDKKYTENISTLIYYENGKIYSKSSAALQAGKKLGGLFCLSVIFYIIPDCIRDRIYDFIAGRRYAWFGKMDACRIPSPADREKFLP